MAKAARFRSNRGGGVRTAPDVGRIAAAVSRPGIDPRVWLSFAVVLDVAFDAEEGLFVEVQLMPDGEQITCLLGSEYAGDGFGTFKPPKPDDLVIVAIPEGDTGMGPVLISRVWSGPPPAEFEAATTVEEGDATTDPTMVVEPLRTYRIVARDGATTRIEVDGSGKVQIAATGAAQIEITGETAIIINSPDVRLGPEAGAPMARVGDIVVGSVPAMIVGPGPAAGSLVIPAPPGIPTATGGVQMVGQITSGQAAVKG